MPQSPHPHVDCDHRNRVAPHDAPHRFPEPIETMAQTVRAHGYVERIECDDMVIVRGYRDQRRAMNLEA